MNRTWNGSRRISRREGSLVNECVYGKNEWHATDKPNQRKERANGASSKVVKRV